MSYRLPQVERIENLMADTRKAAIQQVREAQATCKHDRVIAGGDRRICAACGLEERARYSFGWPGFTIDGGFYEFVRPAGKRTVLNTEFVKQGDVVGARVHL